MRCAGYSVVELHTIIGIKPNRYRSVEVDAVSLIYQTTISGIININSRKIYSLIELSWS